MDLRGPTGDGERPTVSGSLSERFYRRLVVRVGDGDDDLPDEVVAAVPANATRQVVAHTLQNVGDLVVDAKAVLAWLLGAVGAPAAFVGLLVPIRESGSMLPQLLLAPVVRRLAFRRWVWVVGALSQAAATVAMAVVTATLEGAAAGVGILAALTVLALARSLSSFASKDVLGRTLPKGQRGQINGLAALGSGVAAVTVGLAMRAIGGAETAPATFAWLLVGGAAAWVVAAGVFATVRELPGETVATSAGALRLAVGYLRDDAPFRRFVLARSLLLVSALSPPFVVALANREAGGGGLQGLGPFVISNGVAALLAGRFWGRSSDRSSRRTMMWSAGLSATIVVLFVLATRAEALASQALLYPATYLLLAIAHMGARIGRKTYVVDLADGDITRGDYIAVSNSAMGLILLVAGAVSAAAATIGVEVALLFLAAMGLVSVLVSAALPEVSAARQPAGP